MEKMCVLEEKKICDDCGKCLYCDLDPEKLCDNCCRCIDTEKDTDYAVIEIDEIIPFSSETSDQNSNNGKEKKSTPNQYKIKKIKK